MEYSQSIRKQIVALGTKAKVRAEEGLFIAEGTKCVSDLARKFTCRMILATPTWVEEHGTSIIKDEDIIKVKSSELERMSRLSNASEVIGVFEQPKYEFSAAEMCNSLSVALDGIQDPGNLGTIIRVSDWMGVRTIICSKDTVDIYNPKVVQATMGAIGRVKVIYMDLPEAVDRIRQFDSTYPVYGTYLHGENIYSADLSENGMVVMGNEGHGISEATSNCVDKPITIPAFAQGDTSESLNVAVATAIVLSEFLRRNI